MNETIFSAVTAVTAIAWAADKVWFEPRRRRLAKDAAAAYDVAHGGNAEQTDAADREMLIQRRLDRPSWLQWTAGLFCVAAPMYALQSFAVEVMKIPSGSMMPTLVAGDYVLVDKFRYGMRLPLSHRKLTIGRPVEHGDIVVFRYPVDPSENYIKRVVGLPGDTISYLDKKLTINGTPVPATPANDYLDPDLGVTVMRFRELLGHVQNEILNNPNSPPFVLGARDYASRENCTYSIRGVVCKVPAHQYFMMGDNRDNSADSRYWGFVPEANIVGRAFMVAMNISSPGRIGRLQ
ncbi:signal peptidase I [Burkholderia cepacia]|uniref:signal peptidase I n=1 Tax=Burkholderia cepacia TaxID=292 RepID=UPI002AB7BC3B|nr:signal peptidase I [Burkholderia cepacia]